MGEETGRWLLFKVAVARRVVGLGTGHYGGVAAWSSRVGVGGLGLARGGVVQLAGWRTAGRGRSGLVEGAV